MFADYQEKVLRDYHKKKSSVPLRTTLVHPTPANLRDECEYLVGKRFGKEDMHALKSFFGEHAGQAAYVAAIQNIDIDQFRPLINLLNGRVKKTDRKNVELLAWLIGYDDRPYREGDPYEVSSPGDVVTVRTGIDQVRKKKTEEQEAEKQVTLRDKFRSIPIVWKVAVTAGLIISLSAGTYVAWTNYQPQGCMIWTGDHYQPISCGAKSGTQQVLGLDTEKVIHFKKITDKSEVTLKSLGKVWYSKINNEVEFFTDTGNNPVHTERKLKPVSALIVKEYGH